MCSNLAHLLVIAALLLAVRHERVDGHAEDREEEASDQADQRSVFDIIAVVALRKVAHLSRERRVCADPITEGVWKAV